jgi:hypothetical protein
MISVGYLSLPQPLPEEEEFFGQPNITILGG